MADEPNQVLVNAFFPGNPIACTEDPPIPGVVEDNLEIIPGGMAMIADAGYPSEMNVVLFDDDLHNPFTATGKIKHDEVPPLVRGCSRKELTLKRSMSRKLPIKAGHAIHAKRKCTVEPVSNRMTIGSRHYCIVRLRE